MKLLAKAWSVLIIVAFSCSGAFAQTITSLSPPNGAGGDTIAISGSGFGSSAGTVTLNGANAPVTSWSDTSVGITVPIGATSGNVIVTTVGNSTSNGVAFAVNPLPVFAGPVAYSYDELGRLVGAVAASGDAVRYSYDAVGNILSITRYSSTQFAAFAFSPKSGPVGTNVTISGSNFSINLALDSVSFNGTSATIVSATSTTLVVTVPTGATTGTLSISSPAGSATTSDVFTVTSSNGKPRIDSFSPQIALPATAVTISGANFDTTTANDRMVVNVTSSLNPSSATSTSMSLSTPAATGSGRISLNTLSGAVTSSADLFIPPSGFTVSSVGSTGRVAPGGSSTVTLSTANQIGMVLFDGTKGQMVSVVVPGSSSTFTSTCSLKIYDPTDNYLIDSRSPNGFPANGTCGSSGGFFDSQVLPMSGTYAVVVSPGAVTGHATLTPTLFNDITGDATLSTTINATTSIAGQNIRYRLFETPNQHITISIISSSSAFSSGCNLSVLQPDGTAIANGSCVNPGLIEVPVLAQNGFYTILVDPAGPATGSISFKINDDPDVLGTITADGTPVTVATTVPGQNAKLTFSGTAGQRISVILDNDTYPSPGLNLNILNSAGTQVAVANGSIGSLYIDTTVLPATGTYTIFLNPSGSVVGQARVRLFNVPADATAAGTLGGSSIPITISTPGQNGSITFAGTAGKRISIAFSSSTLTGIFSPGFGLKVLNPSGSLYNGGPFTFNSSSGFIEWNDVFTLPSTGTYTVFLDPSWDSTGSINLTLYDATDASLSINADGTANSVSTTSPSQNARLSFTPTIGQRVSARVTNISYGGQMPQLTLQRTDSSGNTTGLTATVSDGSNLFMDAFTITQAGTYSLFVDPSTQATGSETVTLYTVTDLSGTANTSGTPATIATTVPGQNASYTFSATSGQSLTWSGGSFTYPSGLCLISLFNPDSSRNTFHSCGSNASPWSETITLGQTGTYKVLLDPQLSVTGGLTLTLSVH